MRHIRKRKQAVAGRYFKNREIKIGEYTLSVTSGRTVYWVSAQGNRKLDSMVTRNSLQVTLPNGETAVILQDKEGKLYEQ